MLRHATGSLVLGAIFTIGCAGRPHTPLTKAASEGDVESCRRLLTEQARPNEPGGHGLSALRT